MESREQKPPIDAEDLALLSKHLIYRNRVPLKTFIKQGVSQFCDILLQPGQIEHAEFAVQIRLPIAK